MGQHLGPVVTLIGVVTRIGPVMLHGVHAPNVRIGRSVWRPQCSHVFGNSGMARAAEQACMCWWPHRGLHPHAQCSTSFWAVWAPHPLVWCATVSRKPSGTAT